MSHVIKDIFDSACAHIKFDTVLAHKIIRLDNSFINKNHDHAHFFGQGVLGVDKVVFTNSDRDKLFIDILNIDEMQLQLQIQEASMHLQSQWLEAKKRVPSLKKPKLSPEYENSQDPMNLICIYIAHRLKRSTHLQKNVSEVAQVSILNYMNYAFLTSLIRKYYPYPPNADVARATFSRLSNKFLIKTLGSWQLLVKYRSESIISKDSIWSDVIMNYSDDDRLVECVNDAKGRMNSHVQEVTTLFYDLNEKGSRINTDSSVFYHDGDKILKEYDKGQLAYTTYILDVVNNKDDFIKNEIVDIIEALMPTCSPKSFKVFLNWLSTNYMYLNKNDSLHGFIEGTLEHAYRVLSDDPKYLTKSKDLGALLIKFKGLYGSNKINDESIINIKDKLTQRVSQVCGVRDNSAACAIRTAVLLYILARTFSKSHFAN